VEKKETVAVIKNQFQMSKFECQINSKVQMPKKLHVLSFDVPLAFGF
jgi:hypothetical protein